MLEVFSAASHDEVLQLIIQVAVLLFTARLLGGIARRLNQPSVVGEILAGVILGPSFLSHLLPVVGHWILPQTEVQGFLLEVVSLIGVMLLLIVTGLETDLELIRRKARTAAGVAMSELLLTFTLGLALGALIPSDLVGDPAQRTVFMLFLATALSISAIPVLAKILMDLDLMRRDIGQTLLAAGMIDDITGWTMLGLVTALVGVATISVGTVVQAFGMVAIFLVATATLGVWLVNRGISFVQDRFRGPDHVLTLVMILAFAWGAFTHALGLEAVIGAFAIGILFGRSPRLPADTIRKVESMALAVFAPIFFATAGLKVDVLTILEPRMLLITLAVIGVATVGKIVGAYIGARWLSGQDHWTAVAYGAGLNARGAMEIILATIGLSVGILTQEMFSIIVVMAVVTSLMAPVLLRWALSRTEPDEEEARRLAREQMLASSFVGSIRRVLVPVRPGPQSVGYTREMQATLLNGLFEFQNMTVRLLTVTDANGRAVAAQQINEIEAMFENENLSSRVVISDDPAGVVLAEAENDFNLMVLGAPTASDSTDSLFGPVIDDLVKLSSCPTMLVKGVSHDEAWQPRRILIATNGTMASRRAAELAFAMVRPDAEVAGVHIVTPTVLMGREDVALGVTAELEQVGLALGHQTTTHVRTAEDPATGILSAIEEFHADLLVLGTNVRAGTSRLHLGLQVERLVRQAPCPVVIVNS